MLLKRPADYPYSDMRPIFELNKIIKSHQQQVKDLGATQIKELIESEIPSDRLLSLPCYALWFSGDVELQKCNCYMVVGRLRFWIHLHENLSISSPYIVWWIRYRHPNDPINNYQSEFAARRYLLDTILQIFEHYKPNELISIH
ncbi:MAG: hypothetical protein J7647_01615 [Cyanobacteria bacterium SBLK]|nr:hypothetical protein [Cyanobacteria bacterium SBLK]